MAEITVRMVFNRETGKKDIWIDFESTRTRFPSSTRSSTER